MRVGELGEFGLIARIERAAERAGVLRGASVRLGMGDDGAVVRPRAGEEVVVSTDAFVEGVHFRWRTQSARTAGRRALVASLSDLAAMGARPLGFTWALGVPGDLSVSAVDGLTAGLVAEAATHGAPLVGGNVTGSDQTSLTLTVLGAVTRGRALTRSGARAGARIFVTGELGTSAFEVARAERGAGRVRFVPTPRLAAGRALARIAGVGGCIDVSDGLDADLAHLLAGTELAPELAPDRFPRPARFDTRCTRAGLDAELLLRSGGEDYELLFTARGPVAREASLSRRLGVRVSEIGAVRKGARDALPSGYRHF